MKRTLSIVPVVLACILACIMAAPNILHAQDARASVQAVLARLAPNRQLPDDLILTGQVTNPDRITQPLRITIKGKEQVKYEVGSDASVVTTVQGQGIGRREAPGKREFLKPQSAVQRPSLIPFLDLLAEADTPELQVTDRGAFQVGAIAAGRYTLKLPDPAAHTRTYGRGLDEEIDIYVDLASGVVIRSERWLTSESSMDVRFRAVNEFSDYRIVQGFSIPFRIVSTVSYPSRGPSQATYVISSASVNSGVADSSFEAPEARR